MRTCSIRKMQGGFILMGLRLSTGKGAQCLQKAGVAWSCTHGYQLAEHYSYVELAQPKSCNRVGSPSLN